jgi:hypothetical protein
MHRIIATDLERLGNGSAKRSPSGRLKVRARENTERRKNAQKNA